MPKPDRVFLGHMLAAIHDYFEVDLDIVWRTATENVPNVAPDIRKAAQELEG